MTRPDRLAARLMDGMAGTARISARASRLARRRGDGTGTSALVRRMQSGSGWCAMPDDGDRLPEILEWVLLALMLLAAVV